MLLFPIISGIIVTLANFQGLSVILIQTVAFVIAFLIGTWLANKQANGLRGVGLRGLTVENHRTYLWFFPLLIIEIMPYFLGIEEDLSIIHAVIYLLFALTVGFAEELYFRGLVINVLKDKRTAAIIIVSSLLFSVGHFFNLLSGKNLISTVMQVIFALLFGIVTALITLATQSFLVPVVWHTIHNFGAMITVSNDGKNSAIFGGIQGLILIVYALYLWHKKPDQLKIIL